MLFHTSNPSALIEAVFERIRHERMAGMPMLNPALRVTATGFVLIDRREWRGALVTPWSLNLLLLPATAAEPPIVTHERVFRKYPAGAFVFLGNREPELGGYLSCSLFHDMSGFQDQKTAVATAHACLLALEPAPAQTGSDTTAPKSPGRRRFLTMGG